MAQYFFQAAALSDLGDFEFKGVGTYGGVFKATLTTEDAQNVIELFRDSDKDGGSGLSYTPAGSVTDIEVWVRCKTNVSNSFPRGGIIVRGSEDGSSRLQGYVHHPTRVSRSRLDSFVSGGAGTNFAEDRSVSNNAWHHRRLRVSGTQLRWKIWQDGNAEPAEWGGLYTGGEFHADSTYPAAGFVGLYVWYRGERLWVSEMGIGTNGDAAPTEPLAAGDPPQGSVTISAVEPGVTTAEVTYSYDDTDETGYERRILGGPAASIGASPATITGLTASTPYDIEVRPINASGSGAWSAPFEFTTVAADPGNTAPSFDGPSIDSISGMEGAALSSLDVSARFSDAESSLMFSAVGSWPAGVTVSSAGVIGGTPTTAGSYSGLQARATDAGALTADSNTFTITVAAPTTAGITVTEPLKNNAGTLLANQSGVRVAVLRAIDLVSVHEQIGLTTDAAGLLSTISDAAIVPAISYHVVIKLADGSVGITGPVTAL